MIIYNGIVSYSETITICGSATGCLWDCNINEYYNGSQCSPCLNNCSSCRNSNDCNLCVNSLCTDCSLYNICSSCAPNASIVSGICQCDIKFYSELQTPGVSLCKSCSITCLDYCTGNTPCECNSIIFNTRYNIDTCCFTSCPSGYEASSNDCLLINITTMDFTFDNLIKTFLSDDYGNTITINSPPYPYYQRGYFLNNGNSLTTSNITVSETTTFMIWIKQITCGYLLSIDTLNITSNQTGISLLTENNSFWFDFMTFNWTVLILKRWTSDSQGYLSLQFYPQNAIIYEELLNCNFLQGQYIIHGGFSGFVWRISLYNTITDISFNLIICTATILTNCLWNCDDTSYLEETCLSCTSGCSNCRKSYDCNLCVNSLCTECNYYYNCSSCIASAELVNDVCQCKSNYFEFTLQNGAPTCVNCNDTCLSTCTGSQPCDCTSISFTPKLNVLNCCY